MKTRTRDRLPIVPFVLILAAGCGQDAAPPSLSLDTATRLWMGSDTSTDWFHRIVVGRVTPAGSFAFLDASAPYVRVYDPDGSIRQVFLGRGSGPGEAKTPVHLVPLSDGRLVVGEGSRFQVFDSDGNYVSEIHVPQQVVAAVRGCGDDLIVYGPAQGGPTERRPWLIAYPTRDSIHVGAATALYEDTAANAGRGQGKKVLASDGRKLVVFDEYSAEPRLLLFDCSRLADGPTVIPGGVRWEQSRRASKGPRQLKAGTRVFAGVAVLADRVMWIWSRLPERLSLDASGTQEIYISDGKTTSLLAYTPDPVDLLDGRDDTVLLASIEEIPRARVLSFRRLVEALRN